MSGDIWIGITHTQLNMPSSEPEYRFKPLLIFPEKFSADPLPSTLKQSYDHKLGSMSACLDSLLELNVAPGKVDCCDSNKLRFSR